MKDNFDCNSLVIELNEKSDFKFSIIKSLQWKKKTVTPLCSLKINKFDIEILPVTGLFSEIELSQSGR